MHDRIQVIMFQCFLDLVANARIQTARLLRAEEKMMEVLSISEERECAVDYMSCPLKG